jgi:hypothetical protein
MVVSSLHKPPARDPLGSMSEPPYHCDQVAASSRETWHAVCRAPYRKQQATATSEEARTRWPGSSLTHDSMCLRRARACEAAVSCAVCVVQAPAVFWRPIQPLITTLEERRALSCHALAGVDPLPRLWERGRIWAHTCWAAASYKERVSPPRRRRRSPSPIAATVKRSSVVSAICWRAPTTWHPRASPHTTRAGRQRPQPPLHHLHPRV